MLQHAAGDQLGYAAKLTGGPGPAYADPATAPLNFLGRRADWTP